MPQVSLNDELLVHYPESFHIMTEEEQLELYVAIDPHRWCIRDDASGVTITVMWHVSHKLFGILGSSKSLAQRSERIAKRTYGGHGYVPKGFFSRAVGGAEAWGFDHEYQSGGEGHAVRTVVLKHGGACYTFYCYARKGVEEAVAVFDELLDSVAFA